MKEGQQPDPGREAAIDWIQEQMETYGLTVEDLQALGCFDAPPKPAAPVYMNAAGGVGRHRRNAGLAQARGQRRAEHRAFPGELSLSPACPARV